MGMASWDAASQTARVLLGNVGGTIGLCSRAIDSTVNIETNSASNAGVEDEHS